MHIKSALMSAFYIRKHGFDKIFAIAIVVAGPAYADSVSGIESLTCQLCHRCRRMLTEPDILDQSTLVASTNLTEVVAELNTVPSLVKQHETGLAQPFPDVHPILPYYWNQIGTY